MASPANRDVWIDFLVPAPILRVDPMKVVLGVDLVAVLSPMMRGPIIEENGQRIFPLRLPAEDTGFVLQLRTYGALGVKPHRGRVAMFIPPNLQGLWEANVRPEVRGQATKGKVGNSPAVAYLLNLEPGASLKIDLPMIGALGIRLSPEQPMR